MASKAGAILGLVGSILMLITALFWISLSRLPLFNPDPNFPAFLPYIIGGITIAISAFGMSGAVLAFRDYNFGYIFLLVAGVLGVIGSFIPVHSYDSGYMIYTTYLSNTLVYIDLVLMILGGILGFALADKTERKL